MFDQETPLPPVTSSSSVPPAIWLPTSCCRRCNRLELAGKLPEGLNFVAFARREWDDAIWRDHVKTLLSDKLKAEGATLDALRQSFRLSAGRTGRSAGLPRSSKRCSPSPSSGVLQRGVLSGRSSPATSPR